MSHLEQDISQDEGEILGTYLDPVKRWSAGLGRCLETDPLSGAEWKYLLDNKLATVTLRQAGAEYLLDNALAPIKARLAHDYDFWPQLNEPRQDALTELAYQIGVSGEEAFHDMIAAIRVALIDGNWAPVMAAGLQSKWAAETSSRARVVLTQLCSGTYAPGR
jgi:GH24 family phage-related lysozyme (muramidase)